MKGLQSLFIFIVLFIFFLEPVYSNFNSQVILENNIQKRITDILKPIDNSSFVIVDLKFKKINARLPGTSMQPESIPMSGFSDSFNSKDIERIDIQIFTKLDPIPEEIKSIIKASTQLSSVKVFIDYKKIDDLTSSLIKDNLPFQNIKNDLTTTKDYFIQFAYSMIFILILFLVVGAYFIFKFKNIFEKSISTLASALSESTSGSQHRQILDVANSTQNVHTLPASDPSQTFLPHNQQNPFEQFSIESIMAIFTDCYWCKEDSYALWIWNRLSGDQKLSLIEKWPETEIFIRAISHLSEKNINIHLHPAYLKPFHAFNTSLEDLAKWLESNPGAWGFLSPLRQLHCPLSLEERIRYISATPIMATDTKPLKTKEWRSFESSLVVNQISEMDEDKILENNNIVPIPLRKNIPSLVWLALLPLDERKKILEEVSAGELAQCWVGSKKTLDCLIEALPEKKYSLLKSYLEKSTPNKNSKIFKHLITRALEHSSFNEGNEKTAI